MATLSDLQKDIQAQLRFFGGETAHAEGLSLLEAEEPKGISSLQLDLANQLQLFTGRGMHGMSGALSGVKAVMPGLGGGGGGQPPKKPNGYNQTDALFAGAGKKKKKKKKKKNQRSQQARRLVLEAPQYRANNLRVGMPITQAWLEADVPLELLALFSEVCLTILPDPRNNQRSRFGYIRSLANGFLRWNNTNLGGGIGQVYQAQHSWLAVPRTVFNNHRGPFYNPAFINRQYDHQGKGRENYNNTFNYVFPTYPDCRALIQPSGLTDREFARQLHLWFQHPNQRNGRHASVRFCSLLIFGAEPGRRPRWLACALMALDLIHHGDLTWDQVWGARVGNAAHYWPQNQLQAVHESGNPPTILNQRIAPTIREENALLTLWLTQIARVQQQNGQFDRTQAYNAIRRRFTTLGLIAPPQNQ